MSRKTMDEYDTPLYNIFRPPSTMHPQNDDTRAQDLIEGRLNDESAVPAYRVPWKAPSLLAPVSGHLEDATENFRDSVWSVSEGKKDIRNLKTMPEK
jgi:hypothetical protein